MLEAVGHRTQPKTAFALAQHLWDHPDKVAAVDARLRDALKTLDKMPAYKGYSQQPRYTSLEGARIAAWQYLRRDGAKYALSWLLPGGNQGAVDLSPAFSKHGNDPQLGQMKATKLHYNDEHEFTRTSTLGPDSDANEVRRLLLLTVARREANEPDVLGKAFEQYAINHATAWDFDTSNDAMAPPCDPRLADLGHWVNYVHANLRTTRPTFKWLPDRTAADNNHRRLTFGGAFLCAALDSVGFLICPQTASRGGTVSVDRLSAMFFRFAAALLLVVVPRTGLFSIHRSNNNLICPNHI